MGCSASESRTSVPISNSIMHLLHSGQTDAVIKKIEEDPAGLKKDTVYNFRGDTLLHYACSKNNRKLIEYLLQKGADKNKENTEGQTPADLVTDSSLLSLF